METLSQIRDQHLRFLRDIGDGNNNRILSGFEKFDSMTGGYASGEFIVLGGRPGMGKSSFAIKQAIQLARNNIPVLFYTMDLNRVQLFYRFLCQLSGEKMLPLAELTGQDILFNDATIKLEKEFSSLPIYIVEDFGGSIEKYEETILEFKSKFSKKGFVIADFLQEMKMSADNRDREISVVIRRMKKLARTTGLPTLCLSQLSRAVETRGGDKRPQLSDLRESGSIEQEADKVLMLHRAEYYGFSQDAEGNSTAGLAEISILRNKTGAVGTLDFSFDENTGDISDVPQLDMIKFKDIRPNEFNDDPF